VLERGFGLGRNESLIISTKSESFFSLMLAHMPIDCLEKTRLDYILVIYSRDIQLPKLSSTRHGSPTTTGSWSISWLVESCKLVLCSNRNFVA
jgi:hypothetical protein